MTTATSRERDPICERDERIAMLEQKLSEYDRKWADACVALTAAGISDWVNEEGSDPKEGRVRLMTLAERIFVLAGRAPAHNIHHLKCRNLDCWLCHGTPANAGPR